ncbi:MAG: hypothetical protein ABSH19_00345 [Opitutales bacterium]|jgi:hypothetical protein
MNPQVILAKIKAYPLAVGLAVAAIIMAGLAYYQEGTLDDDLDASKDLDQQSTTMADNLVFGRDLDASLKQLEAADQTLQAALIEPENIIENQQYFYGFEHIDGLHIIDPTQEHTDRDKDATMSVTTFSLQASGTWESITSFLYELQTGPHLVRVSKFSLEKFTHPGFDAPPEQLIATMEVQVLGN